MTDENKSNDGTNNSVHKSSVAFSIDDSETAGSRSRKKRPSMMKRVSKRMSKRSSFFNMRSLSFRR